jgi:hypothetical protein
MLKSSGYSVVDNYISSEECEVYLETIRRYQHDNPLPEIYRPDSERPLRYQVIDGDLIREHFPQVWRMYNEPLKELASELFDSELAPLKNLRAGVNINIMAPDRSTYRWHYDRTPLTMLLYLNEVDGGETELFPNYRVLLENGSSLRLQRWLDRFIHLRPIRAAFAQKVVVAPRPGRLLAMLGNRAWHSVRSHAGPDDRVNIVVAYDCPGTRHAMEASLDTDLYTDAEHEFVDPNYGI